jgi:hypothetical protein
MIKSEDGVWHATVPLPPGHYLYRFIVDGESGATIRVPILHLHDNPPGGADAVVEMI